MKLLWARPVRGNPKTLILVHRSPLWKGLHTTLGTTPQTTPTDPSIDHPQNSAKIINISLMGCPIDYFCWQNFENANITDLGSGSGASYITPCHFIHCGYTVTVWGTGG